MSSRKPKYKFQVVEIVWDDASSLDHGWVDPEEEHPTPQLVTTIGFLVHESPEYLVLASTTDGTWVNSRFQIPVPMIKSKKVLFEKHVVVQQQVKAKDATPAGGSN